MSYSSLITINKEYKLEDEYEFKNSWLFSPIVWDVLLEKYMHDEIQTPYGYTKSIIGFGGNELWAKLNSIMNSSDNLVDRVCWELSNQQIFFTKNKKLISDAILQFLKTNKEYKKTEDGDNVLEKEHIMERWNQLAKTITDINDDVPCFVQKNTSVDDSVVCWFHQWDEDADEYKVKSLSDIDKLTFEFVDISNDDMSFVSNLSYFEKE